MTKAGYIGLLVLAVLVGLFIGYCVLTPTWQASQMLRYDVLKDTLTIVLAVSAVGIAVLGYGIYLILSGRLKTESALASRIEALKGAVRQFLISGYMFWEYYENTGKKQAEFLKLAIDFTERALATFNELPADEAKKRDNEKALCKIKNNLAYYYADALEAEDIAKEYAEYIKKMMPKYAEEKENWLDTYNHVYQRFSANNEAHQAE